jgi:hypothetical protein
MAELSETYIHLRPFDPSEAVLRDLGRASRLNRVRRCKGYLWHRRRSGTYFRKGLSEIVDYCFCQFHISHLWGVGNYKGFKESVLEMCKDARRFGFNVCQKFQSAAGTSEKQIYRVEKRLKTPGRISRLIRRMERLEENLDKLDHQQVRQELIDAGQQLEIILLDLPVEDTDILQQQLRYRNLPPIKQWPEPLPSRDHSPQAVVHPTTYRQDGQSITIEDRRYQVTTSSQDAQVMLYHNKFPTASPPPQSPGLIPVKRLP